MDKKTKKIFNDKLNFKYVEIAREILAEGETLAKIMRYTGLTKAQIKELK